MLYTCKKERVRLAYMSISISYDWTLIFFLTAGESPCRLYHQEQVVCPRKMRCKVFTTAAVDNINHNPISTTAKPSFPWDCYLTHASPCVSSEGWPKNPQYSWTFTSLLYRCPIRHRQHHEHSRYSYQRVIPEQQQRLQETCCKNSSYKKVFQWRNLHGLRIIQASWTYQPAEQSAPP